MQAWINVGSPENFEVLRKRRFDLSPFKSSRERQSHEMRPGDLADVLPPQRRVAQFQDRRTQGVRPGPILALDEPVVFERGEEPRERALAEMQAAAEVGQARVAVVRGKRAEHAHGAVDGGDETGRSPGGPLAPPKCSRHVRPTEPGSLFGTEIRRDCPRVLLPRRALPMAFRCILP